MTIKARTVQRRPPSKIWYDERGALRREVLHDIKVASRRSNHERTVALVIRRVEICTMVADEHVDSMEVAARAGCKQCAF